MIDQTPLIFWKTAWIPICAAEFAENTHGTEVFCRKLHFQTGKAWLDFDVKNEADTFMIGQCNPGDTWPYCSGGCNFKTIGHKCIPESTNDRTYTYCGREMTPKLFIDCYGTKLTRNIFSCQGLFMILMILVSKDVIWISYRIFFINLIIYYFF